MPATLLRKGLRRLLRGDVRDLVSGFQTRTDAKLVEPIEMEDPPVWQVPTDDRNRIYRVYGTEYHSIEPTLSVTIRGDPAAEAIEIPLVSVSLSDVVRIRAESADGRTAERNLSVETSYVYPEILWTTIDLPAGEPPFEITIDVDTASDQLEYLPRIVSRIKDYSVLPSTRLGSPSLVPAETQPPIFLISIDTLRWDHHEEVAPLIEALGDDATVPSEPRTQGTWTPPSHASMFTGTHPGTHGYVGWGKGEGDKRPIDPKLTTIPEVLRDAGYKCSALVSHSQILPEFGFGRGFHRFRHDQMSYSDWVTRKGDARSSVSQAIEWIDRDLATRDHSLFYFLHVFDLHNPYVPPVEYFDTRDVDFSRSASYEDQIDMLNDDGWTYLDGYGSNGSADPALESEMREWYSTSIEYVARQIARFVQYLKTVDLFEESLIIVTGDHGEEFGERGFYTHVSLYDANIRPFMAIKPPTGATWGVRDQVDTIDFLPTIAHLVDHQVPEDCGGQPLQSGESDWPRITERIYPDFYNVAVEIGGRKGIFTFPSNYPDRPDPSAAGLEPNLEEFYDLTDVRNGEYGEAAGGTGDLEIQDTCKRFLQESKMATTTTTADQPSQETLYHLEDLGYK